MTFGGRLEAFFSVPSSVTISVTNNGGGPTTVSIAAGSYTVTSFCSYLQTALTAQRAPSAGAWSVSVSTGTTGTGQVTIAMSSGTYSITWTSTDLRDLLGFTATITSQTSVTGTKNARGLWLPDCPLWLDGDPATMPEISDARNTESPDGTSVTLVNSFKAKHRNLTWSHVLQNRTMVTSEVTANSSWQTWLRDTQWGRGHSWFSPGSPFNVYWSSAGTDTLLGGSSAPEGGWKMSPVLRDFNPQRVSESWNGVWRIVIPAVVAAVT